MSRIKTLLKKCNDRWFPITAIITDRERLLKEASEKRFSVVTAGRRSYKTETAKRYWVKMALGFDAPMPFFFAAPTHRQAKAIFWEDLKLLSFSFACRKKPSETELTIYLDNGARLVVLGLDVPERFEGVPWAGGIIDEFDNVKKSSWLNVRPAFDSVFQGGYRAKCWFTGVPEGQQRLYEFTQQNAKNPEWGFYTWKSSDVLSPEAIEQARRNLSERDFLQEYCGEFIGSVGLIYGNYSIQNQTDEIFNDNDNLIIACDQNYSPHSTAILTKRTISGQEKYFVLDEIVMYSADSRDMAEEFCRRYLTNKRKSVTIYGDPSGRNGEKHGLESDYVVMESIFRKHGWTYKRNVERYHDSIKNRQNSLRSLIKNANNEIKLFVNPQKAKTVHAGLSGTKFKEGSLFIEDSKDDFHHITTALGYFALFENPIDYRIITSLGDYE